MFCIFVFESKLLIYLDMYSILIKWVKRKHFQLLEIIITVVINSFCKLR